MLRFTWFHPARPSTPLGVSSEAPATDFDRVYCVLNDPIEHFRNTNLFLPWPFLRFRKLETRYAGVLEVTPERSPDENWLVYCRKCFFPEMCLRKTRTTQNSRCAFIMKGRCALLLLKCGNRFRKIITSPSPLLLPTLLHLEHSGVACGYSRLPSGGGALTGQVFLVKMSLTYTIHDRTW